MVGIKKLYHFWAKFYNPTLALWTNLFARSANKQFMKLLEKYVKRHENILDVGVGTGNNIKRMKKLNIPFNSYEGIDLSTDMLKVTKKLYGSNPNIHLRIGDITKETLTKKYDTIISTWVFSHLEHPEDLIPKLQSTLNKDGHFILLFLSERPEKFLLKSLINLILKFFSTKSVPQKNIHKFPDAKYNKTFKWFGGNISMYVFKSNTSHTLS